MTSPGDLQRAERVAKALRAVAHPARVLALFAFRDSNLSPIELTRLLGRREYNLGVVSYHVRRLAAAGIVELSETIPRRGAVEHRYTLTQDGARVADAIELLAG